VPNLQRPEIGHRLFMRGLLAGSLKD